MTPARRVLVTGAAGFIGSHLVDALLARGVTVVGLDNLSMGRRENLAHLERDARFSLVVGDVRDRDAIERAAKGCEAVVHLAAMKIPRYGDSLQTLVVNCFGTELVLDVARRQGARVLLASTSDVYGKSDRLPYAEDGDLLLGPSPVRRWSYAVSKLYNEHLAFAYQEAYQLGITVLRFFGAYGPRQHRSWWGGPQAVFIEQLLRGEAITVHGDGRQTRTFTFVEDTVAGIVAAFHSEAAIGEIFNIGHDEEIEIIELARLLHRLLGRAGEPKIEWVPYASFSRRYEDVRRRVPDVRKAEATLGFRAKVSLRDGLQRTIAWQRPLIEAELRGQAAPEGPAR